MHHLVFGINFQIHSVSLVLVSIHLLVHLSTHLSHHPRSRHRSLLHSFIPGSKPTFSTNPYHLRLLLLTGLPSRQRDWTGLITLISLFLVSHFIFFVYSMWYTISWLPVSFLLHVKYFVLHCIARCIALYCIADKSLFSLPDRGRCQCVHAEVVCAVSFNSKTHKREGAYVW